LLDTGNRDLDLRAGSYQNGRVQDAVLLRANQFLAFEKKYSQVAFVFDPEIGNGAGLVDFLNDHRPVRDCVTG
jgi:hypothetical protein